MDECYNSDGTLLACTTAVTLVWRPQTPGVIISLVIKLAQTVAPQMDTDSIPDSVFVLYFGVALGVVLVPETSRYCQQYLNTSDSGPSGVPGSTQSEMLLFCGDHYSDGTLHNGDSTRTQQTVDRLQCLAALSLRCCFFLAIIIQMGCYVLASRNTTRL